ncbi:MAG: hypothetical protein V4711_04355 [Pseudomonadota bacterium]
MITLMGTPSSQAMMGICFLQDLFKKLKHKFSIHHELTDVSQSAGRATPTCALASDKAAVQTR